MTNLIYNQMKPKEQKFRFQGIAQFFLDSYLSFHKFDFFVVLLSFGILWLKFIDLKSNRFRNEH